MLCLSLSIGALWNWQYDNVSKFYDRTTGFKNARGTEMNCRLKIRLDWNGSSEMKERFQLLKVHIRPEKSKNSEKVDKKALIITFRINLTFPDPYQVRYLMFSCDLYVLFFSFFNQFFIYSIKSSDNIITFSQFSNKSNFLWPTFFRVTVAQNQQPQLEFIHTRSNRNTYFCSVEHSNLGYKLEVYTRIRKKPSMTWCV